MKQGTPIDTGQPRTASSQGRWLACLATPAVALRLEQRDRTRHNVNNMPSDRSGNMQTFARKTEFARLRARASLSITELAERIGFSARTIYRWERGECQPRKAALHYLNTLVQDTRPDRQAVPLFRFIDLFAGIGGLRRGFESLGGKCVYTSEWDRFAQRTYQANHDDDHDIAGDITEVDAGDIPPHDVLLAGFPCQPFSIAGVSKKNALNRPHGFRCEAQGTLFFDVARIIEMHRPRAFLLENVKNLVNHDKGRTFGIIHRILTEEQEYQVHWKVLDAKSWVPQHRERIFVVGFREPNSFTFDDLAIPDPSDGPRLKEVLHPGDGSEPEERPYTQGPMARVASKYTLSDHLWGYLQSYAKKHRAAGNGFGFGLVGPEDISRTLSARYYKDGIRDSCQAAARQSPPADAAGMRAAYGVRPSGRGTLCHSGVRHPGVQAVRERRGCSVRRGGGPAHGTLAWYVGGRGNAIPPAGAAARWLTSSDRRFAAGSWRVSAGRIRGRK